MKIYLDYIFFENLVVNLVIIFQTSMFTKSNSKKRYMLLGSLIISIYTVITYILKNSIVENIVIKIIVIGFAIYLVFNPKSIKEYLKKQIYYYIISFTYVGIIISITLLFQISIEKTIVKILIYIVSAGISYLFNKYLWKLWKTNIKNESLTYKLEIHGQEILAFVDTGNDVYDYANSLDVIFMDNKFFEILNAKKLLNQKTNIIIRTVASEDYITGYIVNDVKIYKNKTEINHLNKIVICFSNQTINVNNKYNALISYNLYLEKLKGATL
ncbi:MAG: sigma-E processing peptidase SpoIIGA [Clostridia bacterium]|nr:sigma-E processing peptidase SpoIIGA [Clostridia bacterium]